MARITEFNLRDVRCFEGAQSARLARITCLVGENGTGKSSVLGCYRTLAKMANLFDLSEVNHFDGEPFSLGSFGTIVRQGKSDFEIGARFEDHCHDRLSLTFRAESGGSDSPLDCALDLAYRDDQGGPRKLKLSRPDTPQPSLRITETEFQLDLLPGEISYRSPSTWLSRYIRDGHFPYGGDVKIFKDRSTRGDDRDRLNNFAKFAGWLRASGRIFPPESTFVTSEPDPTLPKRLRNHESTPNYLNPENTGLFEFLGDLGNVLGLWSGVGVSAQRGQSGFQILVETPSGPRNLVDVGYGIHSLLPILSEIYEAPENAVFLLQEPEVHVHPRAQAQFAQWMAKSDRHFLIETHSDHLIDRLRICVMKGLIGPEELSIVCFEPNQDGKASRLHSIAVDELGNVLGAPPSYRTFFRREVDTLLGFK